MAFQQWSPPTWSDAPLLPTVRHLGEWEGLTPATPSPRAIPFRVGEQYEFPAPVQALPGRDYRYELRYQSAHANFWFLPDSPVDEDGLQQAAAFLEATALPLLQTAMGLGAFSGTPADPRLQLIHDPAIGFGIQGMFRLQDYCPRWACPSSAERALLYLSLDVAPLNSPQYQSTVLHELQHALHFQYDGNERRWLNEGLSMLAEHWAGFDDSLIVGDNSAWYHRDPNFPWEVWSDHPMEAPRYYGGSYLLLRYLEGRFGRPFIRSLAASPYDGWAALHHVLQTQNPPLALEQVMAEWHLSAWEDYPQTHLTESGQLSGTLHQYTPQFYQLPSGRYHLTLQSAPTSPLADLPASPPLLWWSYNSELSASRLTRSVDLTQIIKARLEFSIWYDLEAGYDWAAVLISSDDGKTWQALESPAMQPADPEQGLPVPHYTGRSQGWVLQSFDLSPYVGQEIMLRIEVLTDHSTTLSGFFLDELMIPALENAADPSQWQAEGFIQTPVAIPQGWQVVVFNPQAPDEPHWITFEADSLYEMTLETESLLMLMPYAPFTHLPAQYQLEVRYAAP